MRSCTAPHFIDIRFKITVNMKKIFTFLVAFTVSTLIYAQLPQNFSYQAIVRGANNALLSNQKVGIKISLLKGTENGQSVYSEVHTATTNANGLVSIAVGGGTFLEGNFIKIDWANGPYFVKTEIDPEGGTNYSLVTTTQLLSVPYALYAANSQPGPKGDKGEKGDQGTPGKDGLNGKDGKVEFQNLRVSATGDTLYLTNGNFVIIPGLSAANTTSKPTSGYGPTIKDVDGNEYKTVYIGTQQWMGENLKVSKYNDGTPIPNVTDNTQWSNLSTGAWCDYNNSDSIGRIYGKLYNWFAVSPSTNGNKNVCPTGWHVPLDAEWTKLTDYLGGTVVAGGKMKSTGILLWSMPNSEATNSSLFTGIPGGGRSYDANFTFLGMYAYFWAVNQQDILNSYARFLDFNFGDIDGFNNSNKKSALSVRCVKD
jgi:uncharacterized protein (TIGR02145 family)